MTRHKALMLAKAALLTYSVAFAAALAASCWAYHEAYDLEAA